MSSESEDNSSRSPRRSNETNSNNNSLLDDSTTSSASENVSIIGKVKSHVSSIIPSKISRWFSPSANNKNTSGNSDHCRDTLNGCIVNMETGGSRHRRRRIEIDYDDDDEDADDVGNAAVDEEEAELADNIAEHDLDGEESTRGEYNVKVLKSRRIRPVDEDDNDGEVDVDDFVDEDDDDDDDDIETDINTAATFTKRGEAVNAMQRAKKNMAGRNLNGLVVRQPPSKRLRLTTTDLTLRDSPLLTQRRPLVASTPSVNLPFSRSNVARTSNAAATTSTASSARYYNNRLTHSNLYGHQTKREPPYNFSVTAEPALATSGDLPATTLNTDVDVEKSSNSSSVRRSLNIPTFDRHANLPNLRRQSLSTTRINANAGSGGSLSNAPLLRTSTMIHEPVDERGEELTDYANGPTDINIDNNNTINDKLNNTAVVGHERLLLNGGRVRCPFDEVIGLDTASEASNDEGRNNNVNDDEASVALSHSNNNNNSKNDKDDTSRSRTSSFGNSLNFYAHLQGRKSLFGNGQQAHLLQQQQQIHGVGTSITSAFNNSTLSLTSLNRRQFNSSIYGSTSALSDSRLLNIFSPFYKGRTTYGGASAYNKYNTTLSASGIGCAGASAGYSRIAQTVIRPMSSLSTLSSSSNSLTPGGGGTAQIDRKAGDDTADSSSISDTALRILSLLKDISTPLSDAKKVASNLKEHQQLASNRLKVSDLQAARSTRKQNSPYMRPMPKPGLQNGVCVGNSPLPPVRELQVPKMADLMRLRHVQGTTERVRDIMIEKSTLQTGQQQQGHLNPLITAGTAVSDRKGDYSGIPLKPIGDGGSIGNHPLPLPTKHTNKIKNKMTTLARMTSCKDANRDLEVMPEVNLPNIAFPMMQSVPKFDMELAKPNTTYVAKQQSTSSLAYSTTPTELSASTPAISIPSLVAAPLKNFAFNPAAASTSIKMGNARSGCNSNSGFNFALPITWTMKGTKHLANIEDTYKFSQPMYLRDCYSNASQPPVSSSINTSGGNSAHSFVKDTAGFGAQFRKSNNEWDCDTCMVRNNFDVSKCVSCESPRTVSIAATNVAAAAATTAITAAGSLVDPVMPNSWSTTGFGDKFKRASSEWECNECMVRNKEAAIKCVACETPRKGTSAASTTTIISNITPNVPNLFGNAFTPKADTWECDTCLVVNKNANLECIACQSRKPGTTVGSAAQTPQTAAPKFQFGFATGAGAGANPNPTTSTSAQKSDNAFKSLAAAQKADKWSCSACLAQNDSTRNKCVCCEETKPGALATSNSNSVEPKFSFGQSANSKFKFGFAKDQTDAVVPALNVSTTVAGFTFDGKPMMNTTSSTTSGAGITVGANSQTGFTIGSGAATALKSLTTTTTEGETSATAKTVTFNLPAVKSDLLSLTAVTENNKIASGGFKFGSGSTLIANTTKTTTPSAASVTTVVAETTTTATTKTSGVAGFSFNTPALNASSPPSSSTTATNNTLKPTAAGGFSFGKFPAGATTTAAASSSSSSLAEATTNTISHSANTTSTTLAPVPSVPAPAPATTTTTVTGTTMPKFTFGSGLNFANNNVAATTAAVASTSTRLTTPNTTFTFGTFGGATAASTSAPTTTTTTSTAGTAITPAVTTTTNSGVFGTGGFGQKISSNSGSATTTTTTAAMTSIFGQAAAAAITSIATPAQASQAIATNNKFVFGQASNAAAVASSETKTSLPATTTTSPFLFDSSSNRLTMPHNSANSDGAMPKTQTNNSFLFGAAAAAAAAARGGGVTTHEKNKLIATSPSSSSSHTFSGFPSAVPSFGQVVAPTAAAVPATASAASAAAAATTNAATPANNTVGVFGTFGAGSTFGNSNNSTSSIFGTAAPSAVSSTTNSTDATPVFGSATFGSSSSAGVATPAAAGAGANAAQSSNSIFGSGATTATSSGTFGSFGNAIGASPSVAMTSTGANTTFGGFGGTAMAVADTSAIVAPKFVGFGANPTAAAGKPQFNFSNATGMQNTASTAGIFSFGSATASATGPGPAAGAGINIAKPAFNFTATNPSANFNFTGSTLANPGSGPNTPNMTQADLLQLQAAHRPFQFGAASTPDVSIFNFSAGGPQTEATTNSSAPFQFNAATAAPANIFAINALPGSAQNAQQARRKIRAPIRRLTPR